MAAALLAAIPSLAFAQSFQFQQLDSYYSGTYPYYTADVTKHALLSRPGLSFKDDRFDVTYGKSESVTTCEAGSCHSGSTSGFIQLSKPLSGGAASTTVVDALGSAPLTAFTDAGFRNVFHVRYASPVLGFPKINQLWQAWQAPNSSTWNHLLVDGTTGGGASIFGSTAAMQAVRYGGTNHVFYIEAGLLRLRHVWRDPNTSTWLYEVLDGDGGPNGRLDVNLSGAAQALSVLVDGNQLHVFYVDETNGDVRRAFYDGSNWSFHFHSGILRRLGAPISAVMFQGTPHVFYRDLDSLDLLYNSVSGPEQFLDGVGGSVASRALSAIAFDGKMHVFYDDANGRYLRHAEVLYFNHTFSTLSDFSASATLAGIDTGIDYQGHLNLVYTVNSMDTYSSNYFTRLIHGRRCHSGVPCPF
ncbi:hypothetical protein [Corallococcus llansteffanensis]|uniref:Uncharacterized protein n=1 Tax=Corallococcus llansteffanensis TaxID=2316731 RepID=A0A3A8NXJ9_9BACT|nr:hypothetical protein [Corallococcus llansteffanensis]RKH48988.1 hypothetical protein D7V93_32515 [Corallococcus llansteffanensis]